jgi:hypothetical protein
MKPSQNRSDSKGMSVTSIFDNIGPVPIIKNSSSGMASCRFRLGEKSEYILPKKRNLAMRAGLNLKIMTLVVCTVLTLPIGGLQGKVGTQETDGGLHLVSQAITDASDPFSGTWVLNLSKSKFPSQFSTLKNQIAHVVVDASDVEITQETISESNERLKIHVKAKFDGKDYPIAGAPGAFSAAYRRVDKDTIKAVLKWDGKVVGQETGVISPDSKTLAVIYYTMDATGKQVTAIAVFEKK